MPHLSPQTLTAAEQAALLRASAGHPRDHLILSFALGTGLRLGEIVGLNVATSSFPTARHGAGQASGRDCQGGRSATCSCPTHWPGSWLDSVLESGTVRTPRAAGPLFCNQSVPGSRSAGPDGLPVLAGGRRIRRHYPFHATKHSAVTAVYRARRGSASGTAFARHASPLTTTVYAHRVMTIFFRRPRFDLLIHS